jgi:hypothetical protein
LLLKSSLLLTLLRLPQQNHAVLALLPPLVLRVGKVVAAENRSHDANSRTRAL